MRIADILRFGSKVFGGPCRTATSREFRITTRTGPRVGIRAVDGVEAGATVAGVVAGEAGEAGDGDNRPGGTPDHGRRLAFPQGGDHCLRSARSANPKPAG